jgi:hypothetical protein
MALMVRPKSSPVIRCQGGLPAPSNVCHWIPARLPLPTVIGKCSMVAAQVRDRQRLNPFFLKNPQRISPDRGDLPPAIGHARRQWRDVPVNVCVSLVAATRIAVHHYTVCLDICPVILVIS